MRKSQLYRQYAAECRRIAQTMSADQRARLIKIAEAWEACAQDVDKEKTADDDDPAPLSAQGFMARNATCEASGGAPVRLTSGSAGTAR
jgi:hypothetical protein